MNGRAAVSGTTAVRLTRRGRVVVVLAVLVAMLAAAFSLGHAPSQASSRTVKPRTVTVQTGETLWALAERIAPHVDPRLVVAQIEQLNHLDTPVVFGGQQLVIPRS